MVIYIEELLLSNFIIDYIILSLIYFIKKDKVKKSRLILAALFGSFIAVPQPFIANILALNVYKITTAIIMLEISSKQTLKTLIQNFLLLFIVSFIFVGLIKTLNLKLLSPIFVCSYCIFAVIVILKLIAFIHNKKTLNELTCCVSIKLKNKETSFTALIDSGNTLTHSKLNLPVTLISTEILFKISNITIQDILRKDFSSIGETKTISVSTVTGSKNLTLFIVDSLTIKSNNKFFKYNDMPIAIANSNLGKMKALISPKLLRS